MIRKAILATLGVALLGAVVVGTGMGSYIRTSAGWLRDSVKNRVPVAFEIERARRMVDDLVPEIRKNMHQIAHEEAEVARLEERIDTASTRLEKDRAAVVRLKNDLASGSGEFRYAGQSYTADEVRTDLANRFARYKTKDATLDNLRQIYEARRRGLDAAREKLEGMLVSKQQLEVEVENLEAQLKRIEAAQTASEYQFDDSALGRVKELVDDLQKRLDIEQTLTERDSVLHFEIPLEEDQDTEDIVDEVTSYFAEAPAGARVADAQK